jgi:hypothetical protein
MSIDAHHISDTLRYVRAIAGADGEDQLSILAWALVVGCASCGVHKSAAMARLEEMFAARLHLTSLDNAVGLADLPKGRA